MITDAEMDRALAQGVIRIGHRNRRAIRCAVVGCRVYVLPGVGRMAWIEGMGRGYLCPHHIPDIREEEPGSR